MDTLSCQAIGIDNSNSFFTIFDSYEYVTWTRYRTTLQDNTAYLTGVTIETNLQSYDSGYPGTEVSNPKIPQNQVISGVTALDDGAGNYVGLQFLTWASQLKCSNGGKRCE